MHQVLREPAQMTEIVRRRVLRAMIPAVRKLDRVAKGKDRFTSDHQIRACVALARLAPVFIARIEEQVRSLPLSEQPDWSPDRDLVMHRLAYLDSLTPAENAQREAARQAASDAWDKARPGPFKSGAEADEYYRTHPVHPWSEVEDSLWPPHLQEANFMKEHGYAE